MSKETIAKRLQEAGLDNERFIQCRPGEKASIDHTTLPPEQVHGNYGIYATAGDRLVIIDRDDYGDLEDKSGLNALADLPPTLEQSSPHRGGTHELYAVKETDDGRLVAEVLEDESGTMNLNPTYGEIRVANQYVVGAGSQLDGCDKGWCDECSTEDGGRYIVRDRPIAEISAEQLVDVLRRDPTYDDDEDETEENDYTPPNIDTDNAPRMEADNAEIIAYALNESGHDKLQRVWRGDYSDYGGDRSEAESGLAAMLSFWLQGDRKAVERAMAGRDLPESIDPPRLKKWPERQDDSYRESVLGGVDVATEYYDPSTLEDKVRAKEITETAPRTASWDDIRDAYSIDEIDDKKARHYAATKLKDERDFATPRDTQNLHVYDPDTGVFEREGETIVDAILARELGVHYSQHEKTEILGKLRALTYVNRDELNAGARDEWLLCVENGVLDLETRELHDHSPAYLFTKRAPVAYDPDAECEHFDQFVSDIVRRVEDKHVLYEMVGLSLWPTYNPSKFLILFGEGANGKSTFFEVVEGLLGSENISGWELKDLADNRFAGSSLVGKFANIAPDMSAVKIQDMGAIKTLTGGDTTMVEQKGQPAFEFTNSATMLFGANRPPVLGETTTAIKRRIVPIHLPYRFTEEEDDGNPDARDRDELLEELTTDTELSGLLNAALDGLDRLREHGDVSLPETLDERLEYYEQFSDPIKEFALSCLTSPATGNIRKSVVYDAYKQFCEANDYTIKSNEVFFRMLRQTTVHYSESRVRWSGDRERVLRSAAFTDAGLQYVHDEVEISTEGSATSAATLSSLSDGDSGVTVEARVEDVDTDTPDQIAQRVTLVDTSRSMEAVVWDDAGQPELEADECYRLKNVYVKEYEDKLSLNINDRSGVVSIGAGVGNAPTADPGANAEIDDVGDTSAAATDDGKSPAVPTIIQLVTMKQGDTGRGAPHEAVLWKAVSDKGLTPDKAEHALQTALDQGSIYEEAENHYRAA